MPKVLTLLHTPRHRLTLAPQLQSRNWCALLCQIFYDGEGNTPDTSKTDYTFTFDPAPYIDPVLGWWSFIIYDQN